LIALSPSFGDVNVLNATKFAEEPEFTDKQYFTPKKEANFFSNSALNLPVVNQPSKEAATIFCNSSSPNNFPEGGIIVSPGTNAFTLYCSFAYALTREAISILNVSNVLLILIFLIFCYF